MPAIDIFLTALAGIPAPGETAPKTAAGGNDFEQEMTQALIPGAKKIVEKISALPAGKNSAAISAIKVSPPSEALPGEKPDEKTARVAGQKKDAAALSNAVETSNPPPASWLPPVEIFLTPPIFFNMPPPENFSATVKTEPETKGAVKAAGIWAGLPNQPESKTAGTSLPKNSPAVAVENLLPTEIIIASAPEIISPELATKIAAEKKFADGRAPEKTSAEIISVRPGAAETVLPTAGGRLATDLETERAGGQTNDDGKNAAAISSPDLMSAAGKNPAVVFTAPTAAENGRMDLPPINFAAPQIVAPPLVPTVLRGLANGPEALPENAAAMVVDAGNNSGTGVASTLPVMKKSDKGQFFTEPAGQKLPNGGPTRSLANALKLGPAEMPPRRSEKFNAEISTPFTGAEFRNNFNAVTDSNALVNGFGSSSLNEARLQTVERTHDLVSLHALRLVEAKSDTMSVVLKPGGGMELSLELRQRDGVVEVQAVLAQGDFRFLNQHWADLQARLELQGVKLAPLGGEMNFNPGGGNFSRQSAPERDDAAEHALAFAEFAVAVGGASARSAVGVRGWESWA